MNRLLRNMASNIQKIVDTIVREFKPEKVVLFGSHAWGIPKENSDIDLLVLKKDKNKNTREMSIDLERLLANRNVPLDILVYKPDQVEKRLRINDPFLTKIYKEGKLLYEQK